MSVWNLFRNTPQVRVVNDGQQGNQQQSPQQQGNQQQQQDPSGNSGQPSSSLQQNNPNSGNPQNSQQQQGNQNQQSSGLDAFKDMWQTANDGQTPTDPFASPLLNLDPAKFQEQVGKMDFLQGAPQELVQKVMAGNDPQALMDLMNHVGRQSFLMAGQLSTASTNKAGQDLTGRFQKTLPDMFKQFMMEQSAPEHPILSHPAAQPLLQMARQQARMKDPSLSPAEINKRAEQYLATFAKEFGLSGDQNQQGNGGRGDQQSQSKEQDWGQWAGV